MTSIILTDKRDSSDKLVVIKSAHLGYAVMVAATDSYGEADLQLTSKQARALAGWINANIPKEDEGIEYVED